MTGGGLGRSMGCWICVGLKCLEAAPRQELPIQHYHMTLCSRHNNRGLVWQRDVITKLPLF